LPQSAVFISHWPGYERSFIRVGLVSMLRVAFAALECRAGLSISLEVLDDGIGALTVLADKPGNLSR